MDDARPSMTPQHLPHVAVIGLACRLPGANTPGAFWDNLVAGRDSISRAPADGRPGWIRAVGRVDHAETFDADHFRIPSAEATVMDPQQRVLLELAVEALEDAGYGDANGLRVGVFAGTGRNSYFNELVDPSLEGSPTEDMRAALVNEKDFQAARIAFKLGLRGPSITVQAACSTSLTAVALACQSLAVGDCDVALAGGASLMLPDVDGYDHIEGGIYSADGTCRAFDVRASGTVPSSGAGFVVVKRDADARADRDSRRAVIRGWAINNDGGTSAGLTVPSIAGQAEVVEMALARAGVHPSEVSYVEAHGTGTAIGDPVEVEGLRRAFAGDDRPSGSCGIGSVKSNIGHTDAAAGVAALIKVVLAAQHAVLPPSVHFDAPNPHLELESTPFSVVGAARDWAPPSGRRIAGVSSFGLGGMNAHVVVEHADPRGAEPAERERHVLALSAHTEDELERMKAQLAAWLEACPALTAAELADVAFTAAVGRPSLRLRWSAVCASAADAAEALRRPAAPFPPTTRWTLALHGTPEELVAAGSALLAQGDPLVAGHTGEPLDPARAAVLLVRAAQSVSVTFARVTGPRWTAPVLEWLARGAPDAGRDGALAACAALAADAAATAEGPVPEPGPGTVVVGAGHDLCDAVSRLWCGGAPVDWTRFYAVGRRGRVSLPTYPFTRRRFWLDRRAPRVNAPAAAAPDDAGSATTGYVTAFLVEALRDVLGVAEVDLDADFVDDLDGDSLLALEVMTRINQRFDVDVPQDVLLVAHSIREARDEVAAAVAGARDPA